MTQIGRNLTDEVDGFFKGGGTSFMIAKILADEATNETGGA